MRRAAALTAIALTLPTASCGGGEETVSEESLRDCLADAGLSFAGPAELSGPNLGNVSPDFVAAMPAGGSVSLVVFGTEEKARRAAADVRGALQGFGLAGGADLVISDRNAIAVFERPPSAEDRETVGVCLRG